LLHCIHRNTIPRDELCFKKFGTCDGSLNLNLVKPDLVRSLSHHNQRGQDDTEEKRGRGEGRYLYTVGGGARAESTKAALEGWGKAVGCVVIEEAAVV
jgi:hypothetical protein